MEGDYFRDRVAQVDIGITFVCGLPGRQREFPLTAIRSAKQFRTCAAVDDPATYLGEKLCIRHGGQTPSQLPSAAIPTDPASTLHHSPLRFRWRPLEPSTPAPSRSRTSVRSTSGVLGALKCFKGAGGPHRTPALLADGAVVPCASAFRALFGSREPPVPTAPGASNREPVARRNWRTSLPRHLGASVIRQTTPTPPAANPPAGRRYIRSRLVRQGRVRWRRMRFLRENVRRTRFCRFR